MERFEIQIHFTDSSGKIKRLESLLEGRDH